MNRVFRVPTVALLCPGRGLRSCATVSPRTVSRGTGDAVTVRSSEDDSKLTDDTNRGRTQKQDTVDEVARLDAWQRGA